MADVIKTTSSLSIVAAFTDGDDRTLTLENPKGGLSAADIEALNAPASDVLIGDKTGADFSRFKSAKKKSSTITYLDLTPQS